MARIVKNLPAVQEIQVQSLGRKDPLEKGMATHSSILAWRTPWTEEPGTVHEVAESDMTEHEPSQGAKDALLVPRARHDAEASLSHVIKCRILK